MPLVASRAASKVAVVRPHGRQGCRARLCVHQMGGTKGERRSTFMSGAEPPLDPDLYLFPLLERFRVIMQGAWAAFESY